MTTPYRVVKDGKITDEIVHLDATKEQEQPDRAGQRAARRRTAALTGDSILCRTQAGQYVYVAPDEVDLIDVSPEQIWSVATAMIPFLEHDDANRALMGSNMQRQAVPLLKTDAPLVGTGMERRAAFDSGRHPARPQRRHGRLRRRHADRHQHRGRRARRVRAAEVHALQPGHADPPQARDQGRPAGRRRASCSPTARRSDKGEMALGKNLRVAFMSWEGYNFEDAIILSRRLVKDDELTSLHIEEYEVDARTTKLGDEEITRDIPNRSRGVAAQPRRSRHRAHRRRGAVGRPARRQGHAQGRDRADRRGEADPRDLQGEGARGPRHLAEGPARLQRRRHRRQDVLARGGRRPLAGRERPGARVRGQEAQDLRGRQARRPSRQQGRDLQDRARGGHAVPRGRHAGRRDPQPAGRAVAHEHRPDPRDPPRVGRRRGLVRRRHRGLQRQGHPRQRQGLRGHAGVRRRDGAGRRPRARAVAEGPRRRDPDGHRREPPRRARRPPASSRSSTAAPASRSRSR